VIDSAVMVVIDSVRVAEDNSEGVATPDSDGVVVINSAVVHQDAVMVASSDAKAERDSDVPV
jgi:hypothetical protein